MKSVICPSVIWPSVICPSVICPSVICPSVIWPSVICLYVICLSDKEVFKLDKLLRGMIRFVYTGQEYFKAISLSSII